MKDAWKEKAVNVREKILDYTYWPARSFFYRIKLTYDWYVNVLRHDHDWDWRYICLVLKYKLERTRKCLENGHHLHADRDAKQIRLCELLLDRIEKNGYTENSFRLHDQKWGELSTRWEKTDNPYITRSIFSRPNVLTEEQEEQETKERVRLYAHIEYLSKQDIVYLGQLLTKYLKNWWD